MVGKSYFLFSLLQVGLSQEWKAYTPEEVTAEKGSCVQIACNYSYPLNLTNRTRVGIWYYNKSGTVTTAFHSKDQNAISTQFLHRTRLSGDLNDDNCSLIINNVRQQDAGRYHFRIEFDGNNKYSYKPETRLQVSDVPSQEWKGEIPQQVTAQEGLCVQIPCHYSYPSCLGNQSRGGVWFNAESGTSQIAFHSKDHNHALSRFRDRTRLSGDLKDGDCSLIINNIRQEDAGPYYFRIEFDGGPSHSYHPVTRLQVSAEPSQEWKGEIPQQVTADKGSCVQIPCHYSYPSCLGNQSRGGVWFNEETGRSQIVFHSKDHNYKKPRFRNRTRLSGDLKDGDCSLIINNIRREDAGPYYFRIEFDGGPSHSYHPVTRLNVSDFTDRPTIYPAEIIAGKHVDINCTFNTTCNGTAPVLTWDTPTDVPGSVSNTVTQHGVTLTYTSVLSLTPSLKHHGQNLTCRVRYPSVSSERVLILNVTYIHSNKWTIGLLTAGIILSVFVVGILIFFYVRKGKTLNKERVSETNDFSLSSPPVSVEHQANQNILLTEPRNTTGDTPGEGVAPAPQDVSERPIGGDAECGNADKPDDLLYASINFSKLPSGDRTVHREEETEYAQISFKQN
ncbi:myeloid cell surface antigen CD33-like isoform X2 [Scyliorhinus torazame]|uniref:myeloid cell surface antigen CD33-like isoform X2 n=1 Tax=Scyliorhinus torazame TaxID=75743 RepID=UPI003B5CD768